MFVSETQTKHERILLLKFAIIEMVEDALGGCQTQQGKLSYMIFLSASRNKYLLFVNCAFCSGQVDCTSFEVSSDDT